jgi:hypothetical protein
LIDGWRRWLRVHGQSVRCTPWNGKGAPRNLALS